MMDKLSDKINFFHHAFKFWKSNTEPVSSSSAVKIIWVKWIWEEYPSLTPVRMWLITRGFIMVQVTGQSKGFMDTELLGHGGSGDESSRVATTNIWETPMSTFRNWGERICKRQSKEVLFCKNLANINLYLALSSFETIYVLMDVTQIFFVWRERGELASWVQSRSSVSVWSHNMEHAACSKMFSLARVLASEQFIIR